ncbi:MAG: tripartite tricarboxylate transporter substrate binding protein [Burkholderiales bacterium]|nr:tripartite tricarboxylate transporter substrate binding protein [Burkholderiales bacterium]
MRCLLIWLALAINAGVPVLAAESGYPSRSMRFIVPYPPGGGTDLIARVLGAKLSERLGVSVVIDNRGGGNGVIATAMAARSAPDGYTFVIINSSFVAMPLLNKGLPYDPNKDFRPVIRPAESPNIVVARASFGAKSIGELVAMAKAQPGKLTFAEAGFGGPSHLAAELFSYVTGVKMTRISYKGTGPATTDMLGGHVDLMFASITGVLTHVRANKLRGLAVTGLKRSPAMPDVPTVAEAGLPGYEFVSWYGILLPAGTPDPILARLHDEVLKILQQDEVRKVLAAEGGQVITDGPEAFARYVASETRKWAKIIAAMNIEAVR